MANQETPRHRPPSVPEKKEGLPEGVPVAKRLKNALEGFDRLPWHDALPGDLQKKHEQLKAQRKEFSWKQEALATLGPAERTQLEENLKAYEQSVDAYRKNCEKLARSRLRKALKLDEFTDEQFSIFLDNLLADNLTPAPKEDDERFTESQRKILARDYVELEKQRKRFEEYFRELLDEKNLQISTVEKFEEAMKLKNRDWSWANLSDPFTNFAILREVYEHSIAHKTKEASKFELYTGVVLAELSEEVTEEYLKFGREPFFKITKTLKGYGLGATRAVVSGGARAASLIESRVPVSRIARAVGNKLAPPGMKELAEMISKSPFGKKFWKDLLKVESPATVLIIGYYLHSSKDKIKASLNFATFIAGSRAVGAGLELIAMAQELKMLANFPKLRLILSAPGHPVLKFVVAIAALLGLSSYIDKMNSYVSDKIPDGFWKHEAGKALSLVTGGPIFAVLEDFIMGVDPERDRMNYLQKENRVYFDTAYIHDERSWNEKVENTTGNPILKRMWLLEKIDRSWQMREMVHFHAEAEVLRMSAEDLNKKLISMKEKHPGDFDPDAIMDLVDIATSDKDFIGVATVGALTRNDRALEELIDNGTKEIGKVHAYIKGLDTDEEDSKDIEELKQLWQDCLALSRQVAKHTSVYRHIGRYSKEEWLGKEGKKPPLYEEGLAEIIAYQIKRDMLLEYDEGRGITAPTHAHYLTMLAKAEPGFTSLTPTSWEELKGLFTGEGSEYELPDGSDRRLRERNQLSYAVQCASEFLPKDRINEMLYFVGKHARKKVSILQMRKAREEVWNCLYDYLLEKPHWRGPEEFREKFNLPRDCEILVNVRSIAENNKQKAKNLNVPDRDFKDLVLVQYINVGRGATIWMTTGFRCATVDMKWWKVEIQKGQVASDGSASRARTEVISFPEWVRRHPEQAGKLEENFRVITRRIEERNEIFEKEKEERRREFQLWKAERDRLEAVQQKKRHAPSRTRKNIR